MSSVKHRKQFLIRRSIVAVGADWRYLALPDGWFLNYQQDLQVNILGSLITLGHCYSHEGRSILSESFGRFVVIDWPRIYVDACALMSVYYSSSTASSSAALLAKDHSKIERDLSLAKMNWLPLPGSRLAEVKRLFPDQSLNIETGTVEKMPFRIFAPSSNKADYLADTLTKATISISSKHAKVYVALTAGMDSRVLFGAALASGHPFETITQSFEGVSQSDLKLAAEISAAFGIKHTIIFPEPHDANVIEDWRAHTLCHDHDVGNLHLLPENLYRFLKPGDALVRGGCFELGRRYYSSKLYRAAANPSGLAFFNAFEGRLARGREVVASLDAWLSWRHANPNGLDLIDSFYLDQRLAGWLASEEQGLDMIDGTSIHPMNCFASLNALLSPEPAARQRGEKQRELLVALDKRLLDFPINPRSLYRRMRSTLRGYLEYPFGWG